MNSALQSNSKPWRSGLGGFKDVIVATRPHCVHPIQQRRDRFDRNPFSMPNKVDQTHTVPAKRPNPYCIESLRTCDVHNTERIKLLSPTASWMYT